MVQLGGFLGKLLGTLLKTGFLLGGNAFKPLAQSVPFPWKLIAAASATDAAIQKKVLDQGWQQ